MLDENLNSVEYLEWLKKFEIKKTTDDCYTPPIVYDAICEWIFEKKPELKNAKIVRPFFPDGDYTDLSQYPSDCVVIDNPPFSIGAKIVDFYIKNNIKFFLFANGLTIFTLLKNRQLTAIIANADVTYDNGANVCTDFVSNLFPEKKIWICGELNKTIKIAQQKMTAKKKKAVFPFPKELITSARIKKYATAGLNWEVSHQECFFVDSLDEMKKIKKALYGGGFILNKEKTEELNELHKMWIEQKQKQEQKQEQEQEQEIKFSQRELAMLAELNGEEVKKDEWSLF